MESADGQSAQSGDFTYLQEGSTIRICGYTGAGGAVIIPDNVNNLPVTTIGGFYSSGVSSVTIPNSVKGIEDYAFSNCSNLTNVVIGGGVTNLGAGAFYYCANLASINIPDGVTSIADSTFNRCAALTNTVIPSGVTSIGSKAFAGCNKLVTVRIPSGVTNIGLNALSACTGLTAIIVEPGNSYYSSTDGVLFNKGQTTLLQCPGGKTGDYTIPGGVTVIEYSAFANCSSVHGIVIPNGVTTICWGAFGDCTSLASVTIPDSVTRIDGDAFYDCSRLASVRIPEGVTNLETSVFQNCSGLQSVMIGNGVTSIGVWAFDSCASLTSITLPNSVTTIADEAFKSCTGLTNLTLSTNLTSIGSGAFSSCTSLAGITLPNSATNIAERTFYNCSKLAGVTLGNEITSIAAAMFMGCTSLTNVTIQNAVAQIGSLAFFGCTSLTSVTIPGSVASIGESAFGGCTNLSSISIPDSVTDLGGEAFSGCTSLTNVTILGNVASIGSYTFYFCPKLKGVYFAGDAPAVVAQGTLDIFSATASTTVYYRNGTAGWSSSFAGCPTALWRPVLTIDSPKEKSNVPNLLTTLSGREIGGVAPSTVWYRLNQGLWTEALSTNGWTNWFASVALPQKSNTIQAYCMDSLGNVSLTNQVSFTSTLGTELTVSTNGRGRVTPNWSHTNLVMSKSYKLQATPSANWLFSRWTGSTNSTSAALSFVMQPGMTLTANFVTNSFLVAQGTYNGLFAAASSTREQAHSGSFTLSVTSGGKLTGTLFIGNERISLVGAFDPAGAAIIQSKRGSLNVTTALQLDFVAQKVKGSISYGNVSLLLEGDRAVFSAQKKALPFAGQYTLILPGADDPRVGPFGNGYGTVKVDLLGKITFAGSLADGAVVSQQSVVSQDGFWPMYVSLYNGRGSLWCWAMLTNHEIVADTNLSWINSTNSTATALYRGGFTNHNGMIESSFLTPSVKPLLGITNAVLVLTGGNLPFAITNQVAVKANNSFASVPGFTNKLSGTIGADGTVRGTFANPAKPNTTISFNGVVLQNQTGATGWFRGTNESGLMLIESETANGLDIPRSGGTKQ